MSGDMLAVGEYRRNTTNSYSGRVYLYKINPNGTAQLTTTIDSPNPINYGYFGVSVDLSGDRLAIGAKQRILRIQPKNRGCLPYIKLNRTDL